MPASAMPLLQRLAAGDIFWVDQKNAEAQAVLKNGHAYIAATTLPMRPAMSPVLITLVPTEEGIEASEKQRAFFRDLDDAEVAKEMQATRDAVERITAYEAEQKAAYEHARAVSQESGVGFTACKQIVELVGETRLRRIIADARLFEMDPLAYAQAVADKASHGSGGV